MCTIYLCCCRYNALFQFLLRLKRVQMHLEATWQELGRWVKPLELDSLVLVDFIPQLI